MCSGDLAVSCATKQGWFGVGKVRRLLFFLFFLTLKFKNFLVGLQLSCTKEDVFEGCPQSLSSRLQCRSTKFLFFIYHFIIMKTSPRLSMLLADL